MRILIMLLLLTPTAAWAEAVRVPGPEGIMLNAELLPAAGKARGTAIVALHGCSGPRPARDEAWAKLLAAAGHTVLLPDSFGSRGLGSQCASRSRPVTAAGLRRRDALAVLAWLAARPDTPKGGVVLMGWADGGDTVLTTGRAVSDLPAGLIRGLVAYYPSCTGPPETKAWTPSAPLLILAGEPAEPSHAEPKPADPCRVLADRLPGTVTLVTYPDAHRDFDPQTQRPPSRNTVARQGGGDAAAREDSIRRVSAFIAALP